MTSTLKQVKINTPDALIRKASRGDNVAFGEIYELWAQPIYRFVYLKTRDEGVAEDLTADVFLKAWKAVKTFQATKDAKFSTWLFAIARNSVIDYYRTTKQTVSFDELPEIFDVEGQQDLYPETTQLEDKLQSLKPEYKQVLILRYVEDVSINKVAQIMKKKASNIRALTHRALTELRKKLS
ncbi:MAG: RNA polymerase sigma factor [Patescibacteria group bacterium]|nr:RNA polymerase sigma factor [Patescibacteria group bacterium]